MSSKQTPTPTRWSALAIFGGLYAIALVIFKQEEWGTAIISGITFSVFWAIFDRSWNEISSRRTRRQEREEAARKETDDNIEAFLSVMGSEDALPNLDEWERIDAEFSRLHENRKANS